MHDLNAPRAFVLRLLSYIEPSESLGAIPRMALVISHRLELTFVYNRGPQTIRSKS